jgi:hypothetical protein
MKQKFCCDASRGLYEDYYINQAGNGVPIFQGSRGQRGHGFGSILGGLWRSALPLLKRIGRHVLRTGARVATDVADGESFGESASKRIREGINTFNPFDSGSTQTGSGVRRTRSRAIKRRKKNKRRKNHDIFA